MSRTVGGISSTIVEGDVNGDRLADFQIELSGRYALTAATSSCSGDERGKRDGEALRYLYADEQRVTSPGPRPSTSARTLLSLVVIESITRHLFSNLPWNGAETFAAHREMG